MTIGTKVRTIVGCRLEGVVIEPQSSFDDGTYRWPYPKERAVWVRWEDGSYGWTHQENLEVIQ